MDLFFVLFSKYDLSDYFPPNVPLSHILVVSFLFGFTDCSLSGAKHTKVQLLVLSKHFTTTSDMYIYIVQYKL